MTLAFLALQLGGEKLGGFDSTITRRLSQTIDPADYATAVATAVGAEAVFLALFFTTVGVIATTSYADVPGNIRRLFVEERGSRVYLNTVIASFVGGALLLVVALFGGKPRGLTLGTFVLIVVFSVVSLGSLGKRLFNFFDLASLADALPPRFRRALRRAQVRRSRAPSDARQEFAHREGRQTLVAYRQITTLLATRSANEPASATKIATQLLRVWLDYAQRKSSIPTTSRWFGQQYQHRSWLTLDETRLSAALATSTGVDPELSPDPLWFERETAARLRDLLTLLLAENSWEDGIQIVDAGCKNLIQYLAGLLQAEEARLLINGVAGALEAARAAAATWSATLESDARRKDDFVLASVERETVCATAYWLGLVQAIERLRDADVTRADLEHAVTSRAAPYRGQFPRELLQLLEHVATGVELERRAEGNAVTPAWWICHLGARTLLAHVTDVLTMFFNDLESETVEPVEQPGTQVQPQVAMVRTLSTLELLAKVIVHLPKVESAQNALLELRHSAASDQEWPKLSIDEERFSALRWRLERVLASVLPSLPATVHDRSRPDLFGQAYKHVCEATFTAILQGRKQDAALLFDAVFTVTEAARARLVDELAREQIHTQLIYGTEPWVELMELSGYALLMQECDGDGIWDFVKELWDSTSASQPPSLPERLVSVLDARHGVFALSPGDVHRTSRRMQLNQLLQDRGIVREPDWSGRTPEPLPKSAIAAAFAPGGLGLNEQAEDLFVVEYLVKRSDGSGLQLPPDIESLRDRIQRYRERIAEAQHGPHEEDDTLDGDDE